MKKIIALIYFIGLFLLLTSYILFSAPDTSLRISVSTTDALSPDRVNFVRVIVRDLDNGSVFRGFSLRGAWVDANYNDLSGDGAVVRPLSENGQNVFPVPPVQASPAALAVHVVDPEGEIIKTAFVPADTFRILDAVPAEAPPLRRGTSADIDDIFVPAAFLFDVPNDVWLTTASDGRPLSEPVRIKQIYGSPAKFPEQVTPGPCGIAKFRVSISSPADFEFIRGDKKFYASFMQSTKPLHAAVDDMLMTPEHQPVITVTPFGSPSSVTVDMFDRSAWIAAKSYPAESSGTIKIDALDRYRPVPEIIYVRVSASAIGTPDSSQTFAMIASAHAIDLKTQAAFAVDMLPADIYPEAAFYRSVLGTASPGDLRLIRDTALDRLAALHNPETAVRVRTQVDETRSFAVVKAKHKSIANIIFILWIAIGAAVLAALVITKRSAGRENAEDTDAESRIGFAIQVAIIVILTGSLAGLLFYMMQII